MRDELIKFMRFLDSNRSGNLQRQCIRYMANNSDKVKMDTSGINSKIFNHQLYTLVAKETNYGQVKQLITALDELAIKAQPSSDYAWDYYRARNIMFSSFGLSFLLAGSYLIYFMFVNKDSNPFELGPVLKATLAITGGTVGIFLLAFGCFSFILIFYGRNTSFSAPFSDNQAIIFKENLQQKIDFLFAEKLISHDRVTNFQNANTTTTIISAINDIKEECNNYLDSHPKQETHLSEYHLYEGIAERDQLCSIKRIGGKTYFFLPSTKVESSSLIIEELDDENQQELTEVVTDKFNDENTLLLAGSQKVYGAI